ncbi:thiol reductant ABC exporter subunit CydC [Actinomadura keratinilytica]|jgi:thiol reductant ABC exporter CydC subunit|uniref:thiol reductant ABC exporter subunit CydC n=1 Tax=Actinomadura keratinilytica TaxID=547461 RepID=UPI00360931E8
MTAVPPVARRAPLLRLLGLARPLRARLLVAVLAGAATTAAGIALLGVSGFLIARAAEHPGVTALTIAVVAVRALGVSRGVLRYVERLASHDVAFRVLGDVRVRVYRALSRIAPAGLRELRSGDLLTRLVCDVDDTQDVFVRGVVPPAAAALAGGAAVAACAFLLAPAAGALAAGLLVAGVLVPLCSVLVARRAAHRAAAARGRLTTSVVDALSGAPDLIAFGARDRAIASLAAADRDLTRQTRRNAFALALGAGLGTAVTGLTVWAVLLLGVAAVEDGDLGRVPLAVLALTALAAFEAVAPLPAAAARLAETGSSARRITRVLDAPDPVREPSRPLPPPEPPVTVRLRGVRVRYGPDEPWALDGVDLDLEPGRRVALVGPSGAGKSTVAALLLRFVDAQHGQATLNGRDLADYAADDVRRVIGGCPQHPHVFDSTLRENLRLARPGASDDELAAAADAARLLPWIRSLPQGWDTPVGVHGARLSGGERQRLALARALLADPALLVLDEPTAHLDPAARAALTADLLRVTRGRTTLLITHDLTGLDAVDEIVVLDRGRVVQRGTHRELVRTDGLYRRLWARGGAEGQSAPPSS